jgi:hemoglobin
MPYETADRETIHAMVLEFYALVLKDDILGPIFTRVLGEDMERGKWREHLYRLDEFWILLMGGVSSYKGDPTPAHAFIGGLTPESFDRWLQLFKQVVDRLFVEEIAQRFYKKAEIVAVQLRENLGVDDEDDEW